MVNAQLFDILIEYVILEFETKVGPPGSCSHHRVILCCWIKENGAYEGKISIGCNMLMGESPVLSRGSLLDSCPSSKCKTILWQCLSHLCL